MLVNSLKTKNIDFQFFLREMIKYIGDSPDRDDLISTPERVIKSWNEIYGGYKKDPAEILSKTFDANDYDNIIICKNIEFNSTCEHHLLPIVGKAHIGYIPDKKIIGLSKIPRLVECLARRLQIQERLTQEIAYELNKNLNTKGVKVTLLAKHFCACSRGVLQRNSEMVTEVALGLFQKRPELTTEFFSLINQQPST